MIFQMEAPIWESGVKMGRPRKSGRQGGVGQERSKVHLGFGELGGRAGCLFRSAHALLAAPLPFPALPRPPCASISWHPRALPFATHVAPAPRPTCVPPRFSPPSSTRSPLPTIPSLPPRCLFLHLLLLVLLLLRHLHPRPALSAHHVSRSLLQPLKPRSRRQSLHRKLPCAAPPPLLGPSPPPVGSWVLRGSFVCTSFS